MAETPTQPNEYQGKQAIINSDRILFNSKEGPLKGNLLSIRNYKYNRFLLKN